MMVLGVDFTSRPGRKKPITCLSCVLNDGALHAYQMKEWHSFNEFENALRTAGPWIAGIDFPFGQARKFIENIGWPPLWSDYVNHVQNLGRKGLCLSLDSYRSTRPFGDREHRRKTDVAAGSISPQKLYGVPVGMMFFEGAWRLIEAQVKIPGLQLGAEDRIVVEAYPGIIARKLIGRQSYKNDRKNKQTTDQRAARYSVLSQITAGKLVEEYGFRVEVSLPLADDPTGDQLDALLCAMQAAWSWTQRRNRFGVPLDCDHSEGWIADPALFSGATA